MTRKEAMSMINRCLLPHYSFFFILHLLGILDSRRKKFATRAVTIPIFLEPIPEPVPHTKRAITGADSALESVPVVEPAPVLESAPRVEPAPEYEPPFFR